MTEYLLSEDAVSRIQTALNYIEAHPEEWDQKSWVRRVPPSGSSSSWWIPEEIYESCGTVACLAGRIALQAPEITFSKSTGLPSEDGTRAVYSSPLSSYPGAEDGDIEDAVRRLLDPENRLDACWEKLFSGDNDRENLWFYAQEACEGRLTVPADVEPAPNDAVEDMSW